MIGRTLIPPDAKPLSVSAPVSTNGTGHTRTSELDARTLVPADLPIKPVETKSNIPAYMPLDVLASRQLIARDMPVKQLDTSRTLSPYVPLDVVAQPMAVPKDAKPLVLSANPVGYSAAYADVLDRDVLTTGEVNFLAEPPAALRDEKKWVLRGASAVLHAAAFLMIILISQMMPAHQVTQAEIDQAARSLGYLYIPPDMKNVPKAPPGPPIQSPKMKIDPKFLKQIAPPRAMPAPLKQEAAPEAPKDIAAPAPSSPIAPPEPPKVETPRPLIQVPPASIAQPKSGLQLPSYSTGSTLHADDDSLSTIRNGSSSGNVRAFGGRLPGAGGGYGGGGGGGGQGYGAVQMLTPTEGVDFSSYLDRVVASVKRNWYAIMPTSAMMGEKGRVVLQFRIFRDGTVQSPEPYLIGSSGKEPLDRAAASSIHASSPFEPLPSAFSGPYIELRFIFLYNLPLSAAQ
jgi:TonB family protein